MKKSLIFISAIIIVAFSSCNGTAELSNEENDIPGAYQYTGNFNGLAILSKKYFIIVPNMETEFGKVDTLNVSNDVSRPFFVEAGTWSMQDSIMTLNVLYHTDPAKIGTSARAKRIANGNLIENQVLGQDGEVIFKVTMVKLD